MAQQVLTNTWAQVDTATDNVQLLVGAGLSGATLISPTVTGTLAAAAITATTVAATGNIESSAGDVVVSSSGQLHLSGAAGDTLIEENGANQMDFVTGGTARFRADSSGVRTRNGGDFTLDSGGDIIITAGFLNIGPEVELTIATGVITTTGSSHTVDTEADAGTDDLDTINGGVDGRILFLQAESDVRTVVLKDGTGNLRLAGDFSMDTNQDTILLKFSGNAGSVWVEQTRSNNA